MSLIDSGAATGHRGKENAAFGIGRIAAPELITQAVFQTLRISGRVLGREAPEVHTGQFGDAFLLAVFQRHFGINHAAKPRHCVGFGSQEDVVISDVCATGLAQASGASGRHAGLGFHEVRHDHTAVIFGDDADLTLADRLDAIRAVLRDVNEFVGASEVFQHVDDHGRVDQQHIAGLNLGQAEVVLRVLNVHDGLNMVITEAAESLADVVLADLSSAGRFSGLTSCGGFSETNEGSAIEAVKRSEAELADVGNSQGNEFLLVGFQNLVTAHLARCVRDDEVIGIHAKLALNIGVLRHKRGARGSVSSKAAADQGNRLIASGVVVEQFLVILDAEGVRVRVQVMLDLLAPLEQVQRADEIGFVSQADFGGNKGVSKRIHIGVCRHCLPSFLTGQQIGLQSL